MAPSFAEAVLKKFPSHFSYVEKTDTLRWRGKKADIFNSIITGEFGVPVTGAENIRDFAFEVEADLKRLLKASAKEETKPAEEDILPAFNFALDNKSFFASPALKLRETKIFVDEMTDRYIVTCGEETLTFPADKFQASLKQIFPSVKLQNKFLEEYVQKRRLVYAPREPETFQEMGATEGVVFECVNSWVRPKWALDNSLTLPEFSREDREETLKLYFEFMSCLAPSGPDRKTLERFLRDCIFGRAQTVLTLYGTKGTGKTTFTELAAAAVGTQNRINAHMKFGDSRFDSGLLNKTLVVLDEIPVTRTVKNKIKNYLNDEISAEEKFKSLEVNKRVYFSIIVNVNEQEDLDISLNDRRFNLPSLREKKLFEPPQPFSRQKLMEFKSLFTERNPNYSPKLLQCLASYLKETYAEGESETQVRGDRIYEYVLDKFYWRERRFLYMCCLGQPFGEKDFNRTGRKNQSGNMNQDQIADFVRRFFEGTDIRLGTLNETGWFFTPEPHEELSKFFQHLKAKNSLKSIKTGVENDLD